MKKNNTAQKSLLNAEKISKALKENAEKTLKNIFNEAITDMIEKDEDEEKEELEQEDSFEVEDVETENDSEEKETATKEDSEKTEEDEEKEDSEEKDSDEEWIDLEKFKVGDNEYDLTGEDEEFALKVYNNLPDNVQIFYKVEDEEPKEGEDEEEPNTEITIKLEPEEGDTVADDVDEKENETETEDSDELEFVIDSDDDEKEEDEQKWEESDDDVLEIDLEDDDDEEEKKEEIDEADTISTQVARKMVKSKHGQHRPNTPEQVLKVDTPQVNEAIKKIVNKAKEIQAENKQYKEAINGIKKALQEAAVLNINYGKVVTLLVNETATKEEKSTIVERFSKVKTIEEGTELYKTIKRELNETKKSSPIVERVITASSSKNINETPIYNTIDNASLNLLERMENLYRK